MALDMRDGRARTTVNRHAVIDKLDLYKEDVAVRFKKFQASVKTALSTEQIRKFLEANGQDLSGSNDALLRRWYPPRKRGPIKYPISIINPHFDPPYVEDQGFFGRLWPEFIPQRDPYRPANRVEMTLTTYQDEVEINGRRMEKRTFWIYCTNVFLYGQTLVQIVHRMKIPQNSSYISLNKLNLLTILVQVY
ncbi:hypothetical protein ACE6H2_012208 [Prunus campanulata]